MPQPLGRKGNADVGASLARVHVTGQRKPGGQAAGEIDIIKLARHEKTEDPVTAAQLRKLSQKAALHGEVERDQVQRERSTSSGSESSWHNESEINWKWDGESLILDGRYVRAESPSDGIPMDEMVGDADRLSVDSSNSLNAWSPSPGDGEPIYMNLQTLNPIVVNGSIRAFDQAGLVVQNSDTQVATGEAHEMPRATRSSQSSRHSLRRAEAERQTSGASTVSGSPPNSRQATPVHADERKDDVRPGAEEHQFQQFTSERALRDKLNADYRERLARVLRAQKRPRLFSPRSWFGR